MQNTTTYDAIVVGSGITGGWAAKELTEKGLKTLVLERGRKLEHVKDYTTANTPVWELPHRNQPTQEDRETYPIQSTVYAFNEGTKHLWIKDKEHPYSTPKDKPFNWIRGNHVGGRSLMWGRQTYRWSDLDFEANAKDGHGIDWPIRYKDIAPWYSYVEKYIGISGKAENLPQLPDSEFLPPFGMNCAEERLKTGIESKFPKRTLTNARIANLSVAHNGRSACQRRNLCYRGCPYGAYFSSQSSTLPAAAATGNMTLMPDSMVESILYDNDKGRATGVRVIDANTKEVTEYKAKIIFLCASTLGSTQLMMQSTSSRFPNGFANGSGVLGHYLMDHLFGLLSFADFEGDEDKYYKGQRPGGFYIPRFRNVWDKHPDFVRGYGFQGGGSRGGWNRGNNQPGIGADFKKSLLEPAPWGIAMYGFGEILPYKENKIELNTDQKDIYGLPTLHISAKKEANEAAMRKDIFATAAEMLEAAGGKNIFQLDRKDPMGSGIHEMGTARMGKDPKTSVLNRWNQCHEVPNVFVTDGSCMTSGSCVNPSLTYMALTARAVDYAVKELNRRNI
ncbi:MAG: GMC family oxidoreductase [Bacteroidota bacterium]